MKKLIIATLAFLTVTTTVLATDGNKRVNNRVLKQFQMQYADASNVNWNVTADFVKASFIQEDVRTEAFYSVEGEFIGQSTAATIQNLPRKAAKLISTQYGDLKVLEVIEFSTANDLCYYVSLQSSDKKLVLRVSAAGEVSLHKTL